MEREKQGNGYLLLIKNYKQGRIELGGSYGKR
jgi:hypothetical protein